MRRIVMYNAVSLDGFFATADGSLDWQSFDDEVAGYGSSLLDGADTILFGRTTYDEFLGFWPDARRDETLSPLLRQVAQRLQQATKIVFSRTLDAVTWENSLLQPEALPADWINVLKAGPGKDILVYGSGQLVVQLTRLGLIDEYQLVVAPVLLGAGKPLFAGIESLRLRPLPAPRLDSPAVLLRYAPA